MTASLQLTPEQAQAASDILMRQAQVMSAGVKQAFSGKYDKQEIIRLAQNAGNPDDQIKALLTPDQRASYSAYQEEEAMRNASLVSNQEVMAMHSTLGLTEEQMDQVYAALYEWTLDKGTDGAKPNFASSSEAMQWRLEQKIKAVEPLLTETQLEKYRQQKAREAQLMKDVMDKMELGGDAK